MQSLQIHDLFQLLGPNSKPLIDQIEELKKLKSEYEQTVEIARQKEKDVKELHRVNYGTLEAIQYETNQRQRELEEMKAALILREANSEQRELQLQERINAIELKEAQLRQLQGNLDQRNQVLSGREAAINHREQVVDQREQQTRRLIEDLKGYLCQLT